MQVGPGGEDGGWLGLLGTDFLGFFSSLARRGMPEYGDEPEVPPVWDFEAGLPDPATFPVDDLVRLSERVLRLDTNTLGYGGRTLLYGHEGLRDTLVARVAERDSRTVERSSVMLTSGSAQAIFMALAALVDPGDVVAVEAPTWNETLAAVRRRGAEAIAVPVDR